METSMIMHLAPAVRSPPYPKRAMVRQRNSALVPCAKAGVGANAKWTQVTQDTGVGDPRKASKEKSEKFFKAVAERVAIFFEEVAKTKPSEFYIWSNSQYFVLNQTLPVPMDGRVFLVNRDNRFYIELFFQQAFMNTTRRTSSQNHHQPLALVSAFYLHLFLQPIKNKKLNWVSLALGQRGSGHVELALRRNDVEVVAICDIQQRMIDMTLNIFSPKPTNPNRRWFFDTIWVSQNVRK